MAGDHLALVNVLEYVGDHRGSGGTAVDLTADVALVNSRERVSGLVSRQKSGEPGCRALFVLGSPLRGAGFPGDFNIVEAGLMRGAACAIDDINHPRAHLIERLRRKVESSFRAYLIRRHDLVIKGLHLLNEPGLIERSAVGDDAHGLRHLQRSDLDVALANRHVCDVRSEERRVGKEWRCVRAWGAW